MTSAPVLEAAAAPRPATSGLQAPFLLYGLAGFSGLLAEQALRKYLPLLVGATAAATAAVLFTWFLGLALGAAVAARLIRRGRVARPLLVFGLVQLAVGAAGVLFSYAFDPGLRAVALLQNLFDGAALKFAVRFVCGCLPVLPVAALMGASFPLVALALDNSGVTGRRRWSQAWAANLAGALTAAVAAPFLVLPAMGLRGALWLCLAIGAAVCALAAALPEAPAEPASTLPSRRAALPRDMRLLLGAAFSAGAILFALEAIWTHLAGVVIGGSVYTFWWTSAAVLLGLLLGAGIVNRGANAGKLVPPALIFQCAAVLLLVQFLLWDRAPALFTFTPPAIFRSSFYFAECCKLLVSVLLLTPPAAVLGMIYPRILASPQLRRERNAWLCGYLGAAHSLGCLAGALAGIFVLVPVAGSEVSLKALILLLGLFGLLFPRSDPPVHGRRLRVAAVAALLLALTIGRWWNWGLLTAGTGNYFGQGRVPSARSGVRYLPPSFMFRQEDAQGGLTTVVEQTILDGEVARTVRTLFSNGQFQGDDRQDEGDGLAQLGSSALPSLFVPDYGRALLIGLGTGRGATGLRHLGYREIAVAELAPGTVQAAGQCFAGFNEAILQDPRVKLYLADGRSVLLTDAHGQYDLITMEIPSAWSAGAANLYSREFYELARRRLRRGGVLQQWVQLHHVSPREIASQLATARSVFRYVGLWYYGGQGMLVAANHPLAGVRFQAVGAAAGLPPEKAKELAGALAAARLVGPDGVARLVRDLDPPITTDHNRWMEYAAPRYQSDDFDWVNHNLGFLRQYQ